MNKIGILLCNKMTYGCAATGCFNAFSKREGAFEIYQNQEVSIGSVFHCNGCGKNFVEEMDYKFTQLRKSNIKTIHLAKCVQVECDRYNELKYDLINEGFSVIDGTHD